ncbi:MAG: hypothetical protein A2017_01090 [Lentisphaerae bacterium GWF2_44_16]|nr:MAG: hypothetical protein A2017_01090 [Lentisphaerae bacterium GWF2_44_16]
MRFTAISFSVFFILCVETSAADIDVIDRQYQDKLTQARKVYADSMKKIISDTIKRYDAEMKKEISAGHLDEAAEIKKRTERLKQLKADPLADFKEDDSKLVPEGDENAPGTDITVKKAKVENDLEKRMKAFFGAILKEDYEKAREYLDPSSVGMVPPDMLQGFMQLFSGALKVNLIKSEDQLKLKEMTLGHRKNDARVIPRWRTPMGNWHDGDPQYWVLRKGKWYLGDDKQLKNFK